MNFDGLEMQKWNIQTDRAQRVDEKNGIICAAIIFASGVMVIKMSKMAHFLQKISHHRLEKMFTYTWMILFISFRKCYGLLDSEPPLARYKDLKI